jgi:hypothetical protein
MLTRPLSILGRQTDSNSPASTAEETRDDGMFIDRVKYAVFFLPAFSN